MRIFLTTLLVAGALGASSALAASPAKAEDANSLYQRLQQSGAETTYVQRRFGRVGAFRSAGVGRGIGGRGFYGRRGFAGRGYYGRRGFAGRGFYGRRGFAGRGFYGRRGIGTGAVIGGLATGALVGGALAATAAPGPVYAAPARDDAYCTQRFKSYDPASGTYLGYDGQRHPCP